MIGSFSSLLSSHYLPASPHSSSKYVSRCDSDLYTITEETNAKASKIISNWKKRKKISYELPHLSSTHYSNTINVLKKNYLLLENKLLSQCWWSILITFQVLLHYFQLIHKRKARKPNSNLLPYKHISWALILKEEACNWLVWWFLIFSKQVPLIKFSGEKKGETLGESEIPYNSNFQNTG